MNKKYFFWRVINEFGRKVRGREEEEKWNLVNVFSFGIFFGEN